MAKNPAYSDWPFPNERFMMPFTEIERGNFAIDENDVGTPNVRLRSTRPRRFITMRWNISAGDWPEFQQWRRYAILQGALPFNIPDPQNYFPDDANTWLNVRFAVEQMDNACWTEMLFSEMQGYTLTAIFEVL